jgi:predicted DNA-binding protein
VFKTKPIPVRLPEWIIDKLDAAAGKLGYTRAGLIRYTVETWVDYHDKHGAAALPADWERIIREFDGRTVESRKYVENIKNRQPAPKKGKNKAKAVAKKRK